MLSLSQRPHQLTAEILDDLPAEHPDAVSSRRDLRLFNAVLGNWQWLKRVVPPLVREHERVLELGAGVGELGNTIGSLVPQWHGLDRAPRPPAWPAHWEWHQQDIREFSHWCDYEVVAANLVLHHFDNAAIGEIGKQLDRHARVVVISDLRRGRLQQIGFMAMALSMGANRVTRHDGWVSVRAGFQRDELPRLFGFDPQRWTFDFHGGTYASYRLIAQRR